jgi:hypothetical protein
MRPFFVVLQPAGDSHYELERGPAAGRFGACALRFCRTLVAQSMNRVNHHHGAKLQQQDVIVQSGVAVTRRCLTELIKQITLQFIPRHISRQGPTNLPLPDLTRRVAAIALPCEPRWTAARCGLSGKILDGHRTLTLLKAAVLLCRCVLDPASTAFITTPSLLILCREGDSCPKQSSNQQ